MAKFIPLLIVTICGLLLTEKAQGARLAKRQSCSIDNIPQECRAILDTTIDLAAFFQGSDFITTYCGPTCGETLYNYFRDCDIGSNNATKFDFYCSSNANGDRCWPALLQELTAEDSYSSACENITFTNGESTCSPECTMALNSAYERLGCCLFSFTAVAAGIDAAYVFFGFCSRDNPTAICDGGITGEPLMVPTDVNPRCQDLVENVGESCRPFLRDDTYEVIYFGLEEACSDPCGPEIYQFSRDCDSRIGFDNATVLDVLCAANSDGERCGALFQDFSQLNLSACDDIEDFTCPDDCSNALRMAKEKFGCCLSSVLQVISGEDFSQHAAIYSALCDVEIPDNCIGRFSGKPAPLPKVESECSLLDLGFPAECYVYTSIDILNLNAYVDAAKFKEDFCDGYCGKFVYNYFVKQDMVTGGNNASYVDFLCSENSSGEVCASIISDSDLQDYFDNECDDVTDTYCSDECSSVLQEQLQKWGCCLFTFGALDDNVTFIEGIVEECNLEGDVKVCTGGLSGKPIAAPGQMTDTTTACDRLRDAIPSNCKDFTTTVLTACEDVSGFPDEFCKSDCAKPVYNYVNECGEKADAAAIDFACSKTPAGTNCLNIINDADLDRAIEEECYHASDKQCSRECQLALQGFNKVYGCCLFTYSALATNVSFTNGLWAQCEADNMGLCVGGISNAAIEAPQGEVEDASLKSVISSTFVVALALTLSILV